MNNNNSKKYNEHAKFLADIALAILNKNKNVLDVNGVCEIISLYLLIPYITPDTLETPGDGYVIPKLKGNFLNITDTQGKITKITLKNLRDCMCHSFVTTEDGIRNLIFDDRILYSKTKHEQLQTKSKCYKINTDAIHKALIEIFKQIKEF